jgi:hypothetical protein
MIVTVAGDKNALAETVDLTRYFNLNGAGYETMSDRGDFDGSGHALPAAFMPPDGTQELNVNPMLVGKPGPQEYTSGYYSSTTGAGSQSNHRIAFLFGPKNIENVVECRGQRIDLPSGNWKAVHILAASTGDQNVTTTQFVLNYKDGDANTPLAIANWSKVPDSATATVGLRLPYRLYHGDIDSGGPAFLGDYPITLAPERHIKSITLPDAQQIKIVGLTLER